MGQYKIDLSEIKQKIKYVKGLEKENMTAEEREKIYSTLGSYLCLLDSASNVKLFNFLDKISNGKIKEARLKKYKCNVEEVNKFIMENKCYIDEEYLQFLLLLSDTIASPFEHTESLKTINLTNDQIINITNSFFEELGDPEIISAFKKIISTSNSISINEIARDSYEGIGGMCYYDHVYGQPYIVVHKNKNIHDYHVLAHEITHGIDFYMRPKLAVHNYYGFHEVPTYTIDMLFADYLEKNGVDKEEVNKIRQASVDYLRGLAIKNQMNIRSKLREKGIDIKKDYTIKDVQSILDMDIIRSLIEVQSGIMAYGFYLHIKENKEEGLDNLKTFMKSNINPNITPDFSQYGLGRDDILGIGKRLSLSKDNSKEQNKEIVKTLINPEIGKGGFASNKLLFVIVVILVVILSFIILK